MVVIIASPVRYDFTYHWLILECRINCRLSLEPCLSYGTFMRFDSRSCWRTIFHPFLIDIIWFDFFCTLFDLCIYMLSSTKNIRFIQSYFWLTSLIISKNCLLVYCLDQYVSVWSFAISCIPNKFRILFIFLIFDTSVYMVDWITTRYHCKF